MRAIAIAEFGGPEKLEATDLPRPRPGKGDVLIRVVAAGVDALDCKIREGRFAEQQPHAFPLIPGWEAAGVVEEFGEGASHFRKGDRVWTCARKPVVQWGCYAEYVAVPEPSVALMPTRLLFEEAAALPLAGLIAYQGLYRGPGPGPGRSVLIRGAASGVGHLAVQLAAHAGARVYGTAHAADHEFVLGLGALAVIDDSPDDLAEALRTHCPDGIDLELDAIGADDELFPRVEPNAEQLGFLARLADRKQLQPHVAKIFSLAAAAEAHRTLAAGGVRGKLVLNL